MATRPDLRVSDADREATAASLREHYALGRLSLEEFNQRLNAAFTAVTQRDLDAVIADLPHVRSAAAPLPVAGFTAGNKASGNSWAGATKDWTAGQGNAGGQGWAGGTRRGFALVFGMVTSLVVLLVVLAPAILGFSFFGGFGRWGIFTVVVIVIRSILRRVFGLRRFGGCSGRGGRYSGYGRG